MISWSFRWITLCIPKISVTIPCPGEKSSEVRKMFIVALFFFLLPLQGRNPTSSRQWPTQHTMYNSTSPGFHLCKLPILLMEEILHRLRLVVYPIICRVWYIPGGAGFLPSTVLVGKSIKLPWSWICFFGWFFFFRILFLGESGESSFFHHHLEDFFWNFFFPSIEQTNPSCLGKMLWVSQLHFCT